MAQLLILLTMLLLTTETHISLRRRIQIKSRPTHLIGRSYPLRVIQGLRVRPDRPALQDLPDRMVLQGPLALQARQVPQGRPDPQEIQGLPDLLDQQDLLDRQGLQDLRAQTVAMALQGLPALQDLPVLREQRQVLEHQLLQRALLVLLQVALLQPKYSLLQYQRARQDQQGQPDLPVRQDLRGRTQLLLDLPVRQDPQDQQVRLVQTVAMVQQDQRVLQGQQPDSERRLHPQAR